MLKIRIILFALCIALTQGVFAKPVNVNTATAEMIADALTGIGQTKAQRIVDYRDAHGKFKSVQALLIVQGIGPKTLKKNEGDILITEAD